jgi:protein O-GlcNAc transferase
MMLQNGKIFLRPLAAFLLLDLLTLPAGAQQAADDPVQTVAPIPSLGLTAAKTSELQRALDAHNYIAAEKLLLAEIERDPHSKGAAHLLAYAGSIYFLNGDYVGAAIAWKKSDAIVPLEPSLQFSLAMDYIRMAHPDWARKVLESLAAQNPKEALYPYWLGRLDYDGHLYNQAIGNFQRAIKLSPDMARAYDSLGLCYYYQNENSLAIENYKKAIDLNRNQPHPSAWPYLNLAITLQFVNQLTDAESNLREAIRLDPNLAQAHFQLGSVLEDSHRPEAAILELQEAARLDASYPEPHMALARIYHKLGQQAAAQAEVQTYLRLHPHSTP